MKGLKKFSLALGAILLSLSFTVQIDAAVKLDHPEKFKVTKAGHEAAMKKIKELGIDLTNCPVPIENITTDVPEEVVQKARIAGEKSLAKCNATPVNYSIDGVQWPVYYGMTLVGQAYQNNFLVPVDYVPEKNGVPDDTVIDGMSGSYGLFHFVPDRVDEMGGAMGTGGYWWQLFDLYGVYNTNRLYGVWLSASGKDGLLYGY